ncbi:MAG: SH3 domain-containing protein [Candidatus Aminicenantes bacterium]|nr:SH3 domain-containing protein [Candidatus Aminicenantes bacterium]
MKKQAFLFLPFGILALALVCPAQQAPARPMKVKVTAEQANLREKPDIGSAIVQQIPGGTVLEADKKEGEWFFVRYTLEDGGVIGGYIHESLVSVVEQAAAPEAAKRTPERETFQRRNAAATGTMKPAGRSASASFLEFSLSGGAGWTAPRDLNDGAQGFADLNGASLGLPASGPVDAMHLATFAGLELSYRVSPWLSLGLDIDYFRGANGGRVEFTNGIFSETLDTRPSVSAVPVKFGVRFYPGKGFYIRGSLGVYFVKAGYLYRLERGLNWQEWKGTATAHRLGAEAAFGGDWKVGANTSFFVEAGFRMASFSGLSGREVYRNSNLDMGTEEGTLYYFQKVGADSRIYPQLFVGDSKLAEEGVVDHRRAVINLSGMAARAGFRYRF